MSLLLRMRGASFGYGRRVVLAGVDLELEGSTLTAVGGPNGAGKSTLVAGVLGLLPTLAGRVERFTRALGHVPQREALDPVFPLSAREVVRMGAYGRLRGRRALPRAERAAAEEALARVGLGAASGQAFSSLSGGQRQRVLIARALLMRPAILTLDEPTRGLDPGAEQTILGSIEELRAEGAAVLLVSHALESLQGRMQALLWVEGGRVERRTLGPRGGEGAA